MKGSLWTAGVLGALGFAAYQDRAMVQAVGRYDEARAAYLAAGDEASTVPAREAMVARYDEARRFARTRDKAILAAVAVHAASLADAYAFHLFRPRLTLTRIEPRRLTVALAAPTTLRLTLAR